MPVLAQQATQMDVGPLAVVGFSLFFVLLIALFVISLVWVFRDAELRGKSGLLVALMVALLSWPIGLLVWIVFRPNLPSEARSWTTS